MSKGYYGECGLRGPLCFAMSNGVLPIPTVFPKVWLFLFSSQANDRRGNAFDQHWPWCCWSNLQALLDDSLCKHLGSGASHEFKMFQPDTQIVKVNTLKGTHGFHSESATSWRCIFWTFRKGRSWRFVLFVSHFVGPLWHVVPCELWVMIRYVSFDHAMTSCDVFQNGWIEERREILANLSRKASDRFGVGVSEAVRSDLEFEPRIRMIRSVLHKLGLQNRVLMSLYRPSDCSACWDMLDMLKPAGRPGDPRTQQHAWRAVTACGGSHVCLPQVASAEVKAYQFPPNDRKWSSARGVQ